LGLDRFPERLFGDVLGQNNIYCVMNQVFNVHGVISLMVVDEVEGSSKRNSGDCRNGMNKAMESKQPFAP
jgi:hypothetical protein